MRVVWFGLLLSLYFCPVIQGLVSTQAPSVDQCDATTQDCPAVTCASYPCRNNGECIDFGNSHKCECGAGYSGKNCEIIEMPCDQDISTEYEGIQWTEYEAKGGMQVRAPTSKPFCPVLSTIGERAGCKKCYAGIVP